MNWHACGLLLYNDGFALIEGNNIVKAIFIDDITIPRSFMTIAIAKKDLLKQDPHFKEEQSKHNMTNSEKQYQQF